MGIENETKEFLVRIMQTISLVLLWMMVNVFAGIYKGLAFFDGSPAWYNILFYILSAATLVALIIHLSRKWKL